MKEFIYSLYTPPVITRNYNIKATSTLYTRMNKIQLLHRTEIIHEADEDSNCNLLGYDTR
jgi:hypothetical protein